MLLTLLRPAAAPAPPAGEMPVTLADAKAQCRVDGSDHDALLLGLVGAAGAAIEAQTGHMVRGRRSVTLAFAAFPATGALHLGRMPLEAITSVAYTDQAGAEQTLPADSYGLRAAYGSAYLVRAGSALWPATRIEPGAVRVTVMAGYASAADVPDGLRQAALMLVAHLFANREAAAAAAGAMADVPMGYDFLVAPYRLAAFG